MKRKILLFSLKNSAYFTTSIDEFKKIIVSLNNLNPFEIEVIDIEKDPQLAEKYHIDALPTLVINNKKYIGKPDAKMAIKIFEDNV